MEPCPAARVRPARQDDVLALSRVWALAFADKYRLAFGPDAARNTVLLTELHQMGGGGWMLRPTLVAESDGRVLGALVLRTSRDAAGEPSFSELWQALRRHLGLGRALRALFVFAVLETVHSGLGVATALIEMVGVDPDWQGCGIGRQLMEAAVERARAAGARSVVLEVMWGNDRARGLYERLGFAAVKERRSWLLERVTGYRGWTRMVLRL